ncbi:MAG: DUF2007 domain-containing protein [Verrucomicrobiota bacterium]
MRTIATLADLNEAHLLRSILESEGIPAFLPDEHTIQVDWALMNAVGGIRIQVPEGLSEEGREIVARFRRDQSQPLKMVCPKCGHANVRRDRRERNFAIALLVVLGIPYPWKTPYRCLDCTHTWNAKESGSNEN